MLPSIPHLLLLASSAAFSIGWSRGDAMSVKKKRFYALIAFRNRNDQVVTILEGQ